MATRLLTVIVPTYDRPDTLGLVLDCLGRQTFTDFQVIVTDDGSPKPPIDLAAAFEYAVVLNPRRSDGQGWLTRSLNAAMALVTTPMVMHCADDIVYEQGFLDRAVRTLLALDDRWMVVPRRLNFDVHNESATEFQSDSGQSHLWARSWADPEREPIFLDPVSHVLDWGHAYGFWLLWTSRARMVGPFNERICGWGHNDSEWALRFVRDAGGLVRYERDLRIFHLTHGDPAMPDAARLESARRNQRVLDETLAAIESRPPPLNFWSKGAPASDSK